MSRAGKPYNSRPEQSVKDCAAAWIRPPPQLELTTTAGASAARRCPPRSGAPARSRRLAPRTPAARAHAEAGREAVGGTFAPAAGVRGALAPLKHPPKRADPASEHAARGVAPARHRRVEEGQGRCRPPKGGGVGRDAGRREGRAAAIEGRDVRRPPRRRARRRHRWCGRPAKLDEGAEARRNVPVVGVPLRLPLDDLPVRAPARVVVGVRRDLQHPHGAAIGEQPCTGCTGGYVG